LLLASPEESDIDARAATRDTSRETFRQVAYVTRADRFDAAVQYWLDVMQAGPFYIGDFRLGNQVFRGEPTDATCTAALTFHGDVQIEIIKPTNDAPSPYSDWLDRADTIPLAGLYHHFLIDTATYDQTRQRFLDGGATEGMSATLGDGRRMAYLDATATLGCYLEVIEAAESSARLSQLMREECAAWDGSQPLRSYSELATRSSENPR
jgi:methylmalonyl-CoA/ethylmalonyl-CoA epimerase